MNWTGGRLRRHYKPALGNSARLRQSHRSRGDLLRLSNLEARCRRRKSWHGQSQQLPQEHQTSSYARPSQDSNPSSASTHPASSFDALKANLLRQSDWLGTSVRRPLHINFTPVKERESIGRQKPLPLIRMEERDHPLAQPANVKYQFHDLSASSRGMAGESPTQSGWAGYQSNFVARRRSSSVSDQKRNLHNAGACSLPRQPVPVTSSHGQVGHGHVLVQQKAPSYITDEYKVEPVPCLDMLRGFQSFDDIQQLRVDQKADQPDMWTEVPSTHSAEPLQLFSNPSLGWAELRPSPGQTTDTTFKRGASAMTTNVPCSTAYGHAQTSTALDYGGRLFDTAKPCVDLEDALFQRKDSVSVSSIRQALLARSLVPRDCGSPMGVPSAWLCASHSTGFDSRLAAAATASRETSPYAAQIEPVNDLPSFSSSPTRLKRKILESGRDAVDPWIHHPRKVHCATPSWKTVASESLRLHHPDYHLPSSISRPARSLADTDYLGSLRNTSSLDIHDIDCGARGASSGVTTSPSNWSIREDAYIRPCVKNDVSVTLAEVEGRPPTTPSLSDLL